MLNLIRYILGLCPHQWEIMEKNKVWYPQGYEEDHPRGFRYELRCKLCGWISYKNNY